MLISVLDQHSLQQLASTLADAGLPVSDLAESERIFFRFGDGGRVVGFAGLEGSEDDRLLRSLVVVAEQRGRGAGTEILVTLEHQAVMLGVRRLHLLTTTAAEFFKVNGYAVADRLTAPASIAASREFTSLCPASAAYLVKTLDPA